MRQPDADCPVVVTTFDVIDPNTPVSADTLCEKCETYRRMLRKRRSQKVMGAYTHRVTTQDDEC